MYNDEPIPQKVSFWKRFISLFILISLSVSLGSWYFYKEQKINILRDTEVLLWTGARGTVNSIAIWYSAVNDYGASIANSELTRSFVAAYASTPEAQLPAGDTAQQGRLKTQTEAMRVYLQGIGRRSDALRVALVDEQGKTIVRALTEDSQTAVEAPSAQELSQALEKNRIASLAVRQSKAGPLLDVVFPICAESGDADHCMGIGGMVVTLPLQHLLANWLAPLPDTDSSTLVLEQANGKIISLTEKGLVPQDWRQGQIVPGALRGVDSGYATQSIQNSARKFSAQFWRLADYVIPAQDASPARHVFAAGLRVPLLDSWYVVKEVPAAGIIKQIEDLLHSAILGGCIGGGLLWLLLVLRWWWLDGRTQAQLRRAVHSSSGQVAKAINAAFPDGISLLGPDGRFVYVNAAFAEMYGKTPCDFIGKNMADLFDAATARSYEAQDTKVFSDLKPLCFLDTLRNPQNGTMIRYQVHKMPLFDREGKLLGVMGSFHKIEH